MRHSSVFAVGIGILMFTACSSGKPAILPPDNSSPPNASQQSGSGNTVETKASLEKRANAGDKDAQFELGAIYHDGQDDVPKNLALAQQWFEKASAQGEVRSQFNLGVMYYTGEIGKQDYAKARDLFTKSAAQGNPRAQFNLGVMYYRGEGVMKDLPKASDFFTKAAWQNFPEVHGNAAYPRPDRRREAACLADREPAGRVGPAAATEVGATKNSFCTFDSLLTAASLLRASPSVMNSS